ncbi:MAG TPA: EAL domain-containing protein [Chloroflexota bacterium]|nr:EAL domain-containing protein [Chloroflexota bacterium]
MQDQPGPILVDHARLLDLAYDAILVWELQTGSISFWNRGSEELYGWPKGDVLGRTPQAILQTQFPRPLAEINAELVRTQRWEGELVHTRQDGATVVVNSRWALQVGKDGLPNAVLAINRDITGRKRAEAALAHQASHDGLTQLPNRLVLQDRLEQGVAAACAGTERLALLLLDLDRFKEVNDSFGHHAGDELLRQVAMRLAGAVRPTDLVARLGGDEFAVLLLHVQTGEATCIAENLLEILKAPLIIDGHTVTIGASIGIAAWIPPDTDASTMLRQADVAMYVAKRSGRGYAAYAPDQDEHSRDRLRRLTELRCAIEGGELRLHFQPITRLATRTISHVEALVRWNHPDRGLLPPSAFVPLAEQTGLVVALDRWVLGAALDQCRAWSEQRRAVPVAVNLSAHSLHDPDLPDYVAAELLRSGVPAQSLLLELTETAVMIDSERAAPTLSCLRDLGIRIAIDDFGMGNAGFNYLRKLPADQLKIDRGFVRSMARVPADAAIVRAMVDLGHGLGLQVVAEGVEDASIWDDLLRLGCDLAQGSYFCAPMPASELLISSQLPLAPQLFRSKPGAVGHRLKLGPGNARMHG